MTVEGWAFTLVLIIVAVAAVVCAVAWKVAFTDGREAGILHERNMRNTDILRKRREAREQHVTREIDEWDRWAAQLREDDGERLADTGELRLARARHPSARGLSDTGAMAVVTDEYIERMRAEEAAYREGLAS